MELSAEQLDILRHMLGINDPWHKQPKPYRNHYCANKGDPALLELHRLRAVRSLGERDDYEYFACTEAGELAAIRSYKTIRYTKSQRVYRKFLDISDCYSDLTFKRFLTDPHFKEARADA
jgi:hypothetical protein